MVRNVSYYLQSAVLANRTARIMIGYWSLLA